MKKTYDVLVIGPVSLDHNIDYQGNERKEVCFALCEGDEVEAAYAYCNLHSLWKK